MWPYPSEVALNGAVFGHVGNLATKLEHHLLEPSTKLEGKDRRAASSGEARQRGGRGRREEGGGGGSGGGGRRGRSHLIHCDQTISIEVELVPELSPLLVVRVCYDSVQGEVVDVQLTVAVAVDYLSGQDGGRGEKGKGGCCEERGRLTAAAYLEETRYLRQALLVEVDAIHQGLLLLLHRIQSGALQKEGVDGKTRPVPLPSDKPSRLSL